MSEAERRFGSTTAVFTDSATGIDGPGSYCSDRTGAELAHLKVLKPSPPKAGDYPQRILRGGVTAPSEIKLAISQADCSSWRRPPTYRSSERR